MAGSRVLLVALGVALLILGSVGTVQTEQEVLPYAEGAQPSFNREACLEECNEFNETMGRRRGGGGGLWRHRMLWYFKCVEKCEKKFWKEFDRELGNK